MKRAIAYFLSVFIVAALCSHSFAAQKTKAQLSTEITTQLPSSGQGQITAAILRSVLQDMVDSNQQILLINAQTGTTYTFLASDQGKLVTFNNSSPIAASLPEATGDFGTGYNVVVQNIGSGTLTITLVAGTINGSPTLTVLPNQIALIASGGLSVYRAVQYGTVTDITCGAGMSGGQITTSGTCDITDIISASTAGSTSDVPVITWNTRGQLTAVTTATITPGTISAVPTTRIISTGTGLSGGGDLSTDRTLSITDTGVTAGIYGGTSSIPSITVNSRGQITAATTSAVSGAITPGEIGAVALATQDQSFTGGVNTQSNVAAAAAGSFTANCGRGPTQYITADTAPWSITAPTSDGACIVKILNPSSAVTPSFIGFSVGSNVGAEMTTASGASFSVQIWRILGVAAYQIFAHQ